MSDQTLEQAQAVTIASMGRIMAERAEAIATLTARCEALQSDLAIAELAFQGAKAAENLAGTLNADLRVRCEALEQEKAKLNADIAEFHDIVSGYDAITDPEAFPELHERAFKAIGDDVDHTICRALAAAESRCEALTAEQTRLLEALEPIQDRITDYLMKGGFINPEQMEHQKVSELLLDIRAALSSSPIPETTP